MKLTKDIIEAGIVLKGSEIKSIRAGKVNIADSYAIEKYGEIFLINSHIHAYKEASYSNHNPTDDRKLLWNDANHVDKTSLGSFQSGKDYRLGVGVYNSSASGKSSEQSFEIMLIPHTARGKAVT